MDEAAAGYAEKPLPTFEDDPFLAMMQAEGALTPDARVLDIGCGAGLYSIALAPHVAEVVGCDFSEKMIEAARNRATAEGCTNAQFICGNFADLTFNEPFDVVFAHFTPAINSATEFQKMVSLARSWCFMACPTRRRDFVLEEARPSCKCGARRPWSRPQLPIWFCLCVAAGENPDRHALR